MEDTSMSADNLAASEVQAVTSEIESLATSLSFVERQANQTPLEVGEDGETNSWVEALLRESSTETLNLGAVKLDIARRVVICNGRYARFAPLDFALLLVLDRNRNKMMSYARISRRVWGPNQKISVPRLRVRVFRVRQKLDEERMEGIRIINRGGLGYVMELDGQALRRSAQRGDLETRPFARVNVRRKIAIAAE